MILYGKPVAEKIYEKLNQEIKELEKKPGLAVILVGEDPASLQYVKIKEKIAQKLDVEFKLFHFPTITPQEEIEQLIHDLNQNKYIDGILIQLPLPKNFDSEKVIHLIDKKKDVDGFSGEYPAPTAQAIIETLKYHQIDLENKKIAVIGQGRLVGKPLVKILQKNNFQPVICDSKTKDLASVTKTADILVTAVGYPGLVGQDMVKPSGTIIDAGTAEEGGKIKGDVEPSVYEKVSNYTPTPGGIGPVTVACLMQNLVKAAK